MGWRRERAAEPSAAEGGGGVSSGNRRRQASADCSCRFSLPGLAGCSCRSLCAVHRDRSRGEGRSQPSVLRKYLSANSVRKNRQSQLCFWQLVPLRFDCEAIGSPQPPPGGGLLRRDPRSARTARPLGCGLFASDQSRSDWRAAASARRRPAVRCRTCVLRRLQPEQRC